MANEKFEKQRAGQGANARLGDVVDMAKIHELKEIHYGNL